MIGRWTLCGAFWMLAAQFTFEGRAQQDTVDSTEFSSRAKRLERVIEKQITRLGIPGLAIAVVQEDGRFQADGYGYRDLEKRLPVTPYSLFGIGSCTKAFTGAAAVMSAEAGKLSLEDSPKKVLPYSDSPIRQRMPKQRLRTS